ncbi:MAG: carbohydrate ABC transporter permease [Lachnospiraceae bacterium]|nr:carbohydrate ABC transporter permease [Lachnospiraceae bacterium]MBO4558801.1 carbohydrate ABC transporter permease [Lachnospiraceae bacterium]MBR4725760.1 carbohydrate ABC transporter permease [Lachnospiraceae bacterium]MBR5732915.1 carbohydrate ABC transporter permease [Lachnospiraceae bacterium]
MIQKDRGFQIFANALMIFLVICVLAPFFLMLMSSLTDEQTLIANGYSFFPEKFSLYAYKYLLVQSGSVGRGYFISVMITVIGTTANLFCTILYAYPLSRKNLPGRTFFAFYLFFTMLFSGGLVPAYLMWTQTFHIRNTWIALLVPGLLMSSFNVIMMRTYFTTNIPDEVIEAARIDGASEFKIVYKVVFPMAVPITATIALLVGLAYWNDWMNGLYYINDDKMYSIQVLLMKIQRNLDQLRQQAQNGSGNVNLAELPSTSVRMALTVLGILPVMIIYPFLQRYFVKGITIGAVKG